jgi:ABC-2 type transport system ATP-binding protein
MRVAVDGDPGAVDGDPGAVAAKERPVPAGDRPVDGPVVLRARGLRKRFGERQAVDDVGFEIHAGETYGLLGPNGAGKTTTISMVCGLLERDEGEVLLDGRSIDVGAVAAKADLGYVPQELAIYPDLTARENLRFFGQLNGLGGGELRRRVDEVLDLTGLADRADERTAQFSGGMQRRLNIGIGLLHQPRLLLLDEPTVGVDPQSRNAILESIAELGRSGMAILYTTHYMEEAERLCHRVAIIDEGRIRAEGTRRELIALVGQRDRIRLMGSGDLAPAAAAAGRLEGVMDVAVGDGSLELIVVEARGLLPRLLADVADAGAVVNSVDVVEPDLEAVFLHLTGKALRD